MCHFYVSSRFSSVCEPVYARDFISIVQNCLVSPALERKSILLEVKYFYIYLTCREKAHTAEPGIALVGVVKVP